jgi:hypothetical protein
MGMNKSKLVAALDVFGVRTACFKSVSLPSTPRRLLGQVERALKGNIKPEWLGFVGGRRISRPHGPGAFAKRMSSR